MINYDDYVRELAHQIWIDDGRPDGEQFKGNIKIKDLHWLKAKVIADEDFEIFKYLEIQDDIKNNNLKITEGI